MSAESIWGYPERPRRFCWVCVVGTMRFSLMMLLFECDHCGYRTDYDETVVRHWRPALRPADRVVARLDTLTQEEHVAGINAARERARTRRAARAERARAAAARLRGALKRP